MAWSLWLAAFFFHNFSWPSTNSSLALWKVLDPRSLGADQLITSVPTKDPGSSLLILFSPFFVSPHFILEINGLVSATNSKIS